MIAVGVCYMLYIKTVRAVGAIVLERAPARRS